MNHFESPFVGKPLSEQVKNPNIIVGKHSYYSGYYHGHAFEQCVRYLAPDRNDVDRLIIGQYCSIGSGAVFMMAGNQGHRSDWISTFPFFYQSDAMFSGAFDGFQRMGDTQIGHDVWIGSEALIMPGVQIGHGAIIATRAVVTKNVEPYEVVGSNPAKHIRYRFSPSEIDMLLEMAWWDWPEHVLKASMPLLCDSNIQALYHYWQTKVDQK